MINGIVRGVKHVCVFAHRRRVDITWIFVGKPVGDTECKRHRARALQRCEYWRWIKRLGLEFEPDRQILVLRPDWHAHIRYIATDRRCPVHEPAHIPHFRIRAGLWHRNATALARRTSALLVGNILWRRHIHRRKTRSCSGHVPFVYNLRGCFQSLHRQCNAQSAQSAVSNTGRVFPGIWTTIDH